MHKLMQIVQLFFGALGFALIFNVERKRIFFTALGGALAWYVYLSVNSIYEKIGICYFFSALFLGLYAEGMARLCKCPTTIFLAVGFIPLIPGYSLYYTMHYAIRSEFEYFIAYGLETVVIAASLAAGIISSMSLSKIYITVKKILRRETNVPV